MNTPKLTLLLLIASAAQAATPWDVVDGRDYSGLDLFGSDTLIGGMSTKVYANALGSNRQILLANAFDLQGDLVSGGSIAPLDQGSFNQSIKGTAWANSFTQPYAWTLAPVQKPLGTWTTRTDFYLGNASYGTQDISVPDRQTYTLAPGKYGVITMGPGSKIRLSAGQYILRGFSSTTVLDGGSSNDAEIIYDVSGGDIQVDVFEKLFFAGNTRATFAGPALPSRVHWNTWQVSQLDLVQDAAYFYGNIGAPKAKVVFKNSVNFIGTVRAKVLDLGYNSNVCAPPALNSLWHSAGPLGPEFDPTVNDYRSVLSPATTTDTLHASAPADISVSYPDGQVVSPNGTYRVRLYDPKREAFMPGCGTSEYRVSLQTSPDYALRVRGDDWNCAMGGCDGSSWDRALSGVSAAVSKSKEGKEFWLAEGNYSLPNGARLNNMVLRGGFTAVESDPASRQGHPNNTVIDGRGSAVHLLRGRNAVVLDNVRIKGASSGSGMGGAVYMGRGRFSLEQSIMDGNQGSGPGVLYYGLGESEAVMKRNYLSKNTLLAGSAASLIGLGVGAYFYGENLALTENALGGGSVISATDASANLVHNTVIANSDGSAVFAGGNISLTNTLAWQPGLAMASGGAAVSASHSLGHSVLAGDVNLSEDPKLASTDSYGADGVPFTVDDGLMPTKLLAGLSILDQVDILGVERGKTQPTIGVREFFDPNQSFAFGHTKADGSFVKDRRYLITRVFNEGNLFNHQMSMSSYDFQILIPKNKHTNGKNDLYIYYKFLNIDKTNMCDGEMTKLDLHKVGEKDGMWDFRTRYINEQNEYIGKAIFFTSQCSTNNSQYSLLNLKSDGFFYVELPHSQFGE